MGQSHDRHEETHRQPVQLEQAHDRDVLSNLAASKEMSIFASAHLE